MSDSGIPSAAERFASLFPDPTAPARTPAKSWWHRRRRAVVVAIVAVLAIGILATQAFGSSGADYRLATVADQNVDAVLTGVGTIEPVSQATIAFPMAGTVASIVVKLGDSVSAGQPLASLDTRALSQTLDQKQATLAQAQLTLSKALSGQSVSGATSSGAGGSSFGQTSATTQSARISSSPEYQLTAATTSSDPALAAAEQAVVAAEQAVDHALATAATALSAAESVCAGVEKPTPTPTTPTPTTPTPTTPTPTSNDITACQTALTQVSDAQAAVAKSETALADASNALDVLLNQRAASSASSGGSGGSSSGSSQSSGASSSGSSGSGTRSSTSSSPTAADLASYQQAVDAAADQVAVAQQAVAQATIASPIAGTVVAVNLAVGTTVTAASSTADIVVQGAGGYEVSTTIGVDQIPHVAIGDAATVVPDGSHKAVAGTVASISSTPAPNASTTSYLVVIGLIKADAALNNGSTGTTTIVTERAKSALAVPTSAITTMGTRHTVDVYEGGSSTPVTVQVGVVGETWTEVRAGLSKGQQVVLADGSSPLPGSATNSTNSTPNATTVTPGGRFTIPGGLTGGFGGGATRGTRTGS